MRLPLSSIASFALPSSLTHLTAKPTLHLHLSTRPAFLLRHPAPTRAPPPHLTSSFQPLYSSSSIWQPLPSAPPVQAWVEREAEDFTGGVASACSWHEVEWASWEGLGEVVGLLEGLGVVRVGEGAGPG